MTIDQIILWCLAALAASNVAQAGFIFRSLLTRLKAVESKSQANQEFIGNIAVDVRGLKADLADQNDEIKRIEAHDDTIRELLAGMKQQAEMQTKVVERLDGVNNKVDKHFDMVRDSLHEVRTTIGTKYTTREEHLSLLEKIDRIPSQVMRDMRQVLADMRLISRREDDDR